MQAHFHQLNHWSTLKNWQWFPTTTEWGFPGSVLMAGEEILIFPSTCITTTLLFPLPHHSGVPISPDSMPMFKDVFSADSLDVCPSHWSHVSSSACSLVIQMPLSCLVCAFSFRELETCPIFQKSNSLFSQHLNCVSIYHRIIFSSLCI